MRRGAKGFTLIELLVVVSIIMVVLAIALPGLSAFLKGQRLEQAGRTIQTALNEARRASITRRVPHRVILYRYPESQIPGSKLIYAMRVYSDADGFGTRQAFVLPRTIKVSTAPNGGMLILEGDPQPGDPRLETGTSGKVEFRKDGTIEFAPPVRDQPSIPQGFETYRNIYDPNNRVFEVPENFPADIILEQEGEPLKRCFIDLIPGTGRAQYRVIAVGAAGP